MDYSSYDAEYGEKAIREWMATHKIGDGWKPEFGYFLKKLPIVVLSNDQETMPWCVQYAGNGQYFKTRDAALDYFESRIEKAKKMREYNRKYQSENKEKIKESRKNRLRMSALKYLNEHPEEKNNFESRA